MVIHCICEEQAGKVLFRCDRPQKIEQVFLGLTFAKASSAFRRSLSVHFSAPVVSLGFHRFGAGLRSVSYEVEK